MTARIFLLTLTMFFGVIAHAADKLNFSQLTVVPYGVQEFDISTGITTLPDGGDVIDTATNLSLSGAFVRFKDGEFIEAKDVTISGPFGTLTTSEMHLNLVTSTLEAAGNLVFFRDELELQAGSMRYNHDAGIAAFHGSVSGTVPPLQASSLLLNTRNGTMLLLGTYSFVDGIFTLESPVEGGHLLVDIIVDEETNQSDYVAYSNPTDEAFAPFVPFLEE